ncbi:hypothetical protein [Metabacillus endolithicus]|nr:hypothetical protein [Metabacillus endolithicus]
MFTEILYDQKDVINQSWKRCQEIGLSQTDPIENSILTGKACVKL